MIEPTSPDTIKQSTSVINQPIAQLPRKDPQLVQPFLSKTPNYTNGKPNIN